MLYNVYQIVCLQQSLKMAAGWSHEETRALVSVWPSPPLSSPTHKNSEISLRPLSQGNMPPPKPRKAPHSTKSTTARCRSISRSQFCYLILATHSKLINAALAWAMRHALGTRYTWLHVMLGRENFFPVIAVWTQPNHIRSGYNRSGLDPDRI